MTLDITGLIYVALAFTLAPFMFGVINRVKAFFAGRKGRPLLQLYYDIFKLLQKGAVYSRTTSWIFKASPVIILSAVAVSVLIVPYGGHGALLAFEGDLVLLAYLFGLARFFYILAALDTGSSFEGMGASREAQFSVLAEPAFFLALAALARLTKSVSLSGIYSYFSFGSWSVMWPVMTLAAAAILVVFFVENARVPVDDPNTHLELTMIHEVMVLDNSGPDLAFMLYGAALKFWVLGALFIGVVLPARSEMPWLDMLVFLLGMGALSVLVGIVESIVARLRLLRVPQLLTTALALAILAFMFQNG